MDYEEFVRNIGKAGLNIKKFAVLMQMSESSITNLKNKSTVPKHLAVIVTLLGHIKDKKLDFIDLFDNLDIKPQKYRIKDKFGGIRGRKKKTIDN